MDGELLKKINSLPPNHPKIPNIIGYLSKCSDPNLKRMLLDKTKLVDQSIKSIADSSTSIANSAIHRSSVSSLGDRSERDKTEAYHKNIVNLGYLAQNWGNDPNSQ